MGENKARLSSFKHDTHIWMGTVVVGVALSQVP